MKFTGFNTDIGGLDCKNYKIYGIYNTIDFYDVNKARIYQDIGIFVTNSSTAYLSFYPPEGLIEYNISMAGTHFNRTTFKDEPRVPINDTNFTKPDKGYLVVSNATDSYELIITYIIENITPYGNFNFNYIDYSNSEFCKQSISSIYSSVSFSDISYSCTQECFVPFNPIATTGTYAGIYQFVNYNFERPILAFSMKDTNTYSTGFHLQAVNKFFIILRELSIGLMAGLVLYLLELIFKRIDEPKKFLKKL